MAKIKCHECGGMTIECVSSKKPDVIVMGCFKCGIVVKAYRKGKLTEEDIEIEDYMPE